VGIVTAEMGYFLVHTISNLSHEIVVTLIPKLAMLREVTLHAHAGRVDDVLTHLFSIKRRQVAMPIDDLSIAVGRSHDHTVSDMRAHSGDDRAQRYQPCTSFLELKYAAEI
jgi:hypothetical protein